MRTVENPHGTPLEYQFGGAFGVLPVGLSEHPEDRADHIVRKFSHLGVRKVAHPEEITAAEARRERIRTPLVPRKHKHAAKPEAAAPAVPAPEAAAPPVVPEVAEPVADQPEPTHVETAPPAASKKTRKKK